MIVSRSATVRFHRGTRTSLTNPLPIASRISRFSYAIRNIVTEARRVEAQGKTVRYLNIGDPVPLDSSRPLHLIEAVERAMRDGHNGYGPSAGLADAREAVADEYTSRGFPVAATASSSPRARRKRSSWR